MIHSIPIGQILGAGADVCFVAMDFSPRHSFVFKELMLPAIEDNSLAAVRSDLILSAAESVLDEIISVIQKARVILVDITGLNPNVLVELGIAHALHKSIVLVSQDQHIPFDIQPRRIIKYQLSQDGRTRFQLELSAAIRSCIYPKEINLGAMLSPSPGRLNYLVHGGVSDEHASSVFPPIDQAYAARLANQSSQTTAIWEIGVALQKIAWGLGSEAERFVAVDGRRATGELLTRGNVFAIGGPGANPFFGSLSRTLTERYLNCPEIAASLGPEGKKRFYLMQEGSQHPPNQDSLLAADTDVAMVVRCPNPFLAGATVWLAAGIRAYGTEAAVRVLVTPSLISQVKAKVDLAACEAIWVIIKAAFDPEQGLLGEVNIHEAGQLEPRRISE